MSKKPWYAINLAEDGRSATIAVRGVIGDWWEGKSIEQMEYELGNIGAVDEITLRITSFGGQLAAGLAMHNALRRHPARVVAVVEGVVASAGTVVIMAADEIRMYANSTMMIHGVTLLDEDDEPVEDQAAERALNASIIETYAARTGKSADEIAKLIATDTWMTAREAVAAGWADTLIEIGSAAEPAQATARNTLVAIASALDIPADVLDRAQAEAAQPATSEGGDPPPEPPAKGDPAPVVAQAAATFAAQVNALAVANGMGDHVAAWLLDGGITNVAQAEAAIREAREVRDLCAFANAADKAPGFIRARKSLSDVRAELINAAAASVDARHTDSHPKPSNAGQSQSAGSKPAVSIDRIYSTLNGK